MSQIGGQRGLGGRVGAQWALGGRWVGAVRPTGQTGLSSGA